MNIYTVCMSRCWDIIATNFKRDYGNNKQFEKHAAELILGRMNGTQKLCKYRLMETQTEDNWRTTHYDFATSDGHQTLTFEVKTDKRSLETRNWFIEFECRSKRSGIAKTQAQYHIFCNTSAYFCISTHKLNQLIQRLRKSDELLIRKCCERDGKGSILFDEGGLSLFSIGYVIPISLIIEESILLS